MNDRQATRALPGEVGLWVFIFSDLLLFTLYFVLVQWDRLRDPVAFHRERADLSVTIGALNTLVLLTGSWAVAIGTRVVVGTPRAARFMFYGMLTGVMFLLLKCTEWYRHLRAGHRIDENPFQTWYFFLTGFHALHVMGATLFLGVVAQRFRRQESCTHALVEAAGCYWHLVDLLWIGIFLVIYLL